jgi:TonB family protein
MSESWKRWEGRTVDGKFPLQTYLGGSDHSAVFLTLTANSEKAAIKLIPADLANADEQLLRWKGASELAHPNLIRIFTVGRAELDGVDLLYVVMEYAEENLAQILPERALTADEVRGMLPPILGALQYVHDQGLVHGHIQPSNILALGDQVKLSSDAFTLLGDQSRGHGDGVYDPPEMADRRASTAGDTWQTGMALVEVLTQKLPVWDRARSSGPEIPTTVPEPFREIAANCLQVGAEKRWTIAQISDRLAGKKSGAESSQTVSPSQSNTPVSAPPIQDRPRVSAKWGYLLAVAAVAAIVFVFIPRPKTTAPIVEVPPEVRSAPAQPNPVQPKEDTKSQSNTLATTSQPTATSTAAPVTNASAPRVEAAESGVVERVLPQVSPSARRTIQGKIKVRVKVEVDGTGNVQSAKLESAGPSKYFSRIALEAAKQWKFSPASTGETGTRSWKLLFAFSRGKTEASAERGKR